MAPDTMEGNTMKSDQFVRDFCPFTTAIEVTALLCVSVLKTGVHPDCSGSAYVEMGNTKVAVIMYVSLNYHVMSS